VQNPDSILRVVVFARSIRPQKADHLAFFDLEGDGVDGFFG